MKTKRAVLLDPVLRLRFLLVFSICCQPGSQKYLESLEWTPQNPKFQFSNESFDGGRAYYRLSVPQYDSLMVICPNPTTYPQGSQEHVARERRYENLWYVDKESFEACKVGSPKDKAINSRLLECDKPTELKFEKLVFQPFSPSSQMSFPPGTKHYFIATSDGSMLSLNKTSGGHCSDTASGISMRMLIYICHNKTDPACTSVKTDPPTPSTVIFTNGTTNKPEPATQAARRSVPIDTWQLLAIILAVCIVCSLVIHSICLFIVCRRKTGKKSFRESIKLNPQREEDGLDNVMISDGRTFRPDCAIVK